MPTFFHYQPVSNLSLDEVLVGAAVRNDAPPLGNRFELTNARNGYKIIFQSEFGDFTYDGNTPTGGAVSGIQVINAAGVEVYSVTGIANVSLGAFWNTYTRYGSVSAFTSLLRFTHFDGINGGEGNDRIGVYGALGGVLGHAGNDTFIINKGVSGTTIHGSVLDGSGSDHQTDIVEIRDSAKLGNLHNIDILRFADTPTAKTLTFGGSALLDVKKVQGSASGSDTIKFTSASEAADVDISKVTFAGWGRDNQAIRVEFNTNKALTFDDRFVGSAAGEHVTAGNGRDLLYGNKGNDFLDGGDGIDVLDGGDGNDTLIGGGGEGPNILKGGKGNDVYKFKEKVDIIIDSGGLDSRVVTKTTTLSTKDMFEGLAADEALSARKSVSLTGTDKANVLLGHSGTNTLNGRGGNDIIEGRAGSDKLNGDAGNDHLSGGLGGDKLTGAAGGDRLMGGLGKDTLDGGAGKDTFVFDTTLSSSSIDKITKFSTKDDTIALEKDVFSALAGSKLSSSAFYIGAKAHDSNDRVVYNKKTGALYYDADGTGGASALIKFATLDKNLKLAASDFILI